jgi:hypothetical protein
MPWGILCNVSLTLSFVFYFHILSYSFFVIYVHFLLLYFMYKIVHIHLFVLYFVYTCILVVQLQFILGFHIHVSLMLFLARCL